MSIVVYQPGQPTPQNAQPGDFLLVHGTKLLSALIQAGQRIKHPKDAAQWTHVAALDGTTLVEADRNGVVRRPVNKYDNNLRALIRLDARRDKRAKAATYLNRATHGTEYGFLDFASVAVAQITGYQLIVTTGRSTICSQLVAEMLERVGIFLPGPTELVTPADLWAGFVGR